MSIDSAEMYFRKMQSANPDEDDLRRGLAELIKASRQTENEIYDLDHRVRSLEQKIGR